MTIKLVAIDLDGTLLNEEHKISPEVKQAIQAARQAGVKIVICTGRPFPGATAFLKELDLSADDDYVITYNGGLVQEVKSGKVVVRHMMDHDDYLTLQAAAQEAGSHFHAIHNEGIFTPNSDISEYSVREAYLIGLPLFYRKPEDMDPSVIYNKMMMIDKEPVLEAAISRLPKFLWDKYTILRSEPFFLEVLNKQASKGTAVKDLAELLNIPRESVMALGDGGNDVDMIEWAGIGVAMDNARDEVKAVADHITASNRENGVAQALETFVLETCVS